MTQKHHSMTRAQKFVIGFTAMAVLMATTAALASYMTKAELTADASKPAVVHHTTHRQAPSGQQYANAQPACDDSNIVGLVAGGVGGGVIGNQFGKGSGNTAATIGGVLAGAYAGGKYLPTRNATCR